MKLEMEIDHLRQADEHLAAARSRIAHCEALVASGTLSGQNLSDAKALLSTLRAGLEAFEEHRALIAQSVDDLQAGRIPRS